MQNIFYNLIYKYTANSKSLLSEHLLQWLWTKSSYEQYALLASIRISIFFSCMDILWKYFMEIKIQFNIKWFQKLQYKVPCMLALLATLFRVEQNTVIDIPHTGNRSYVYTISINLYSLVQIFSFTYFQRTLQQRNFWY